MYIHTLCETRGINILFYTSSDLFSRENYIKILIRERERESALCTHLYWKTRSKLAGETFTALMSNSYRKTSRNSCIIHNGLYFFPTAAPRFLSLLNNTSSKQCGKSIYDIYIEYPMNIILFIFSGCVFFLSLIYKC